jgi:hypothetical protein
VTNPAQINETGFHIDGWLFERLDEPGRVRVSTTVEGREVALVVTPETWASILASVTPGSSPGELYNAFFVTHVAGL